MTDLFEHVADKQRERMEVEALRARILKLEQANLELRIRLANALSALKPLWNVQARAVRKDIRESLA